MNGKLKLLITGGLGNLGSWLTSFFSSRYDVYVLSRKSSFKLECQYTLIKVDITNYQELKSKINIEFDYCIHVASYNEFFHDNYAKKALDVNSLGTRNLLEVLKDTKIKNFIYLSTVHVYGVNSGNITEDIDLNPSNDYASTHLFAEYYIKQFYKSNNLKYTILRLTNSYGSPKSIDTNKWYLILNDLIKSAYVSGKIVIKSNGNIQKDFIHMGDVASVIDRLLKIKATNDIYNLSAGKSIKIIDIAKVVKSEYDKKFNKNIKIELNNNDKNIYNEMIVRNDKIKKIIDFETHNMFSDEIKNIFNLLEGNNK